MNVRTLLRTVALTAIATIGCAPAQAQLFRAYLSSTGSDSNACTVVAPCRLLPAALAAVADGGEIWMLNSANYNTGTVTVAKSVSILAIPGALGSLVSTGGGDALVIDAPGAKVSLRNLVVRGLDGDGNGIVVSQGGRLDVNGCEIVDISNVGISANGAGLTTTVRRTTIRGAGIAFAGAEGVSSLEEVDVSGNFIGVFAGFQSRVSVANSVLAGNGFGALVNAFTGSDGALAIEDSTISGNDTGVDVTSAPGSRNRVTLSRSMFTGNTTGISLSEAGDGIARAAMDNNIFTGNATAIAIAGGSVFTRGDNTLLFNTTNATGGSLTALPGA